MHRYPSLAIAALLAIASVAPAQIVNGRVVDSTTRSPIPAVTVILINVADPNTRVGALTDAGGNFSLAAPEPGSYTIHARRLGRAPVTFPAQQLAAGTTRSVTVEMTLLPTQLDTVRARRTDLTGFLTKLTSGEEWFNRHRKSGKGFFTSGVEITLSGLSACDYFAKVPGLKVVSNDPRIDENSIHCSDGRHIVNLDHPYCIRPMIDHRYIISGLDSAYVIVRTESQDNLARRLRGPSGGPPGGVDTIGRRFPISQIMGIEVFRNRGERPADFSIPPDPEPVATVRRQLPAAKLSMGAPVPMVRATPVRQCATMLVWTRSYW